MTCSQCAKGVFVCLIIAGVEHGTVWDRANSFRERDRGGAFVDVNRRPELDDSLPFRHAQPKLSRYIPRSSRESRNGAVVHESIVQTQRPALVFQQRAVGLSRDSAKRVCRLDDGALIL